MLLFVLAAIAFRANPLNELNQAAAGAMLAAAAWAFCVALGETKQFAGDFANLLGGGGALVGLFAVIVGATK